jgi:orotidine-5'-phosphate decarboxylase
MSTRPGTEVRPQERIIVALDVPSMDEALELVEQLDGLISFYKIGLELLMSGGMERLLRQLVKGKKVFVDLKLPNDIPETVRRVVGLAADIGVTFLTLSNSASSETIRTAVDGRRGREDPKLLFVPFLSSQDRSDFAEQYGQSPSDFEKFMEGRTALAKQSGADGFIVSGQEIGLLRKSYPEAVLVSPGIRPAGASTDDHKRTCTPAEAIRLGADYIVVGRPIRNAPDRRAAAQAIIDEIAPVVSGLGAKSAAGGHRSNGGGYSTSGTGDLPSSPMLARSRSS